MTSAADDIIGLYRRHARAWAGLRGTHLVEKAWLDRLCAHLPAGAPILDIGCGSGEPIARYLVLRGHSVAAVDSAPEMIALFRRNFPEQTAVVADMRHLDLGRRFAGLIAWDSFFHLSPEHQRGMFAVFRAHAEPGSGLLFTSGPAFGEAIGMLEGEPLYHASLDGDEYRHLLDQHGFQVIAHRAGDPDCGGHTVWLAVRRSA